LSGWGESPLSPTTFPEWQNQQQAESNFVVVAGSLEIGYQVTDGSWACSWQEYASS